MSYIRGWRIIKYAEQQLDFRLLVGEAGGAFAGGSEITEEEKLNICYIKFKRELYVNGDLLFEMHFNSYL